jgi:hypothetical protein
MVTTVALEMEEKRRKEEWEKTQEENKDKVNRENIVSKRFLPWRRRGGRKSGRRCKVRTRIR